MQPNQIEGDNDVTRSVIDEFHSSDIQRDQMEGESTVTRNMIDELHSSDIQEDQMEGESAVTRMSLMNFTLRTSEKFKRKVKVILLEV